MTRCETRVHGKSNRHYKIVPGPAEGTHEENQGVRLRSKATRHQLNGLVPIGSMVDQESHPGDDPAQYLAIDLGQDIKI